MKNKIVALLLFVFCFSVEAVAQTDSLVQNDKKEISDVTAFRHMIASLKEYHDEKAKLTALRKTHKGETLKITVSVDKDDDDDKKSPTLMGYIRQVVGETTYNVYEIQYDRAEKRITSIASTGEGLEPEGVAKKGSKAKNGDDDDDDKPVAKTKKKSKDDDDDDKPAKKEKKEKDEDD